MQPIQTKNDSSETLNELHKQRYSLPDDGDWFSKQNRALHQFQQNQGFLVAWDICSDSAYKCYGVYPDEKTFFEKLLSMKSKNNRCGYELIPENTPCKSYVDVEWEGSQDTEHDRIRSIVKKLREFCHHQANANDIEVYVSCSSRLVEGGIYKNSYHITIPSIMFHRNHDGQMKEFFSKFCEQYHDIPVWYTTSDGEQKCCVDLAVYTTNRCIRLPHCSKKGAGVAFARISGDPHDESDRFISRYDENNSDSWLPFILTKYDRNDDNIIFIGNQDPTKIPPKRRLRDGTASRAKKQRSSQTDISSTNAETDLPVTWEAIEGVLIKRGDEVSKISKVSFHTDSEGDYWKIQCNQRGQRRPCLLDPSVIHDSNNCLLFIRQDQNSETSDNRFSIQYHCTSTKCKQKQLSLGSFEMINDMWTSTGEEEDTEDQQETPNNTNEPHISEKSEDRKEHQAITKQANQQINTENPEDNQYDDVKIRFEKSVFKIRNPFSYGRLETSRSGGVEQTEVCLLKHIEMTQFYCHVHYYDKQESETKGKEKTFRWRKRDFISSWLKDPNKREVSAIDIDPEGTKTDIYNLWDGYLAEKISPSLYFAGRQFSDNIAAKHFAAQPIINHLTEVIAGGNQAHAEYLLDWLANIVQRPYQRSEVAISIFGEQGTGKGIIFDWLRKSVLGPKHTFQTANPENELFAKFASGLVNRTLVQVDEVKSLHEHADKLKDAITNRTVNWEKKGKDSITVPALANLVFTSNNENALKIPTDDRRFVLFRCDSKYKDNTQYFSQLLSHMNTPGVSVWFYKFLKDRDLSNYPTSSYFQASRPITDYYCESQNATIPVMRLFLSAFVNGDLPNRSKATDFFKKCEEWMKAQNLPTNLNGVSFGREMGRIQSKDGGVKIVKKAYGNEYVINKDVLKNFLKRAKHYDESVSTMD